MDLSASGKRFMYVRPDAASAACPYAGQRLLPVSSRPAALSVTTSLSTSDWSVFSTTASAKRSARRSPPSTGSRFPAARSVYSPPGSWPTSKGFITLPLPPCARRLHPMEAGRFTLMLRARTAAARCLWPSPAGDSGFWAPGRCPPNGLTSFSPGCGKSCSASARRARSCETWAGPWRKRPSRL